MATCNVVWQTDLCGSLCQLGDRVHGLRLAWELELGAGNWNQQWVRWVGHNQWWDPNYLYLLFEYDLFVEINKQLYHECTL